jgi:uncharacterized protein (DUF486 family)
MVITRIKIVSNPLFFLDILDLYFYNSSPLKSPKEVVRVFGMTIIIKSAFLLTFSNLFMTFAWYAHLKNLSSKPWYLAALSSWGIALLEYLLQVPANRMGYTVMNLGQLKILQELITLSVFVPFSVLYMEQPLRLNFLWAGLCLLGAVYFIFKA